MTDSIAKLVREIGGSPSSASTGNPLVDVVVTLSNEAGTAAITRDIDGAVMLAPVLTPITPVADGEWEYDHGSLNLDKYYDYHIWFDILDGAEHDYHGIQIAGSGLDADTRASIRRRIGRLMLGRDRFSYGPVTVATSTTVNAQFLKLISDEALKGRNVLIVSGTGAGQAAFVTDSEQASGQITVSPAWTTTPDSSSIIEIWGDSLTPDDVNDAINLAIMDVSKIFGVKVSTTGSTFGNNRTNIALPSGFDWIYRVSYVESDGYMPVEFYTQGDPYQFVQRGGTVYLNGHTLPSAITEITVDGYRKPRLLRTDSDICDVPSAFVVYMASFMLEAGAAEGQQLDPEQHSGRAGNWLRQALMLRNELMTPWEPNTVPVS